MTEQAEVLSAGDARARVAVLEAEVAELRKRVCVPEGCRQRLASEGKPFPKSGCAVCGAFFPRWKECDAMLAAAPAPVERVEQEAVAMLLIDDASVAESGDWDIEPIPAAIEKLARSGGATLPLYTTPQPAPTAAQDVAGLVEVPGWLLEMAEQMRGQPTRSTAHPFWQVRCKRHIPTAEGYNDSHYEVVGDEGVVWRSIDPIKGLIDHLLENHEEWCRRWAEDHDHMKDCSTVAEAIESFFDASEGELPDGLTSVFVQEVEEVVTTHLTQADAEWFIKRKQHDYPPLYTYVESAYWSPQMRQLQDWIISLAHQQREGE